MASEPTSSPSVRPLSGGSATPTLVDDDEIRERHRERLERGETIGRYVILEHIGSGGMGVVYAAYDRDLDRRVAIKLLHLRNHPDRSRGPARLLREAQAMARLSHPNVAAVHEVGTWHEQPFVAMEFVDGPTLGDWLAAERRGWREVVAMLLQAGRGLHAAHEQGLVHRDFKPDNVLIGSDGRARVVDFGLARAQGEGSRDESHSSELVPTPDNVSIRLTETGALAGTPAYMAPEQFRGKASDARTDQFAFCITLWEALYGQRPFHGDNRAQLAMAVCKGELRDPPPADVPAFLRRALRRGLRIDPEERHASMEELLAALDRDPVRTRRRALSAGAAAASIAVLSAVAARWAGPDAALCEGGEDRLAEAWGDEQRQALRTAFGSVQADFAAASLDTVTHELDDYGQRWVQSHREACEATHLRHEQSAELLDLKMACLDRRLGALTATTELLAQADRDAVMHSIRAVTSLPSIEDCRRPEALMRDAAPSDPAVARQVEEVREQLDKARALGRTGRADRGLEQARHAYERALALDHPPLRAEAALALGDLLYTAGEPTEALGPIHEAVSEAIASGHDEVLVNASIELVSLIGVALSRYEEAERWGRVAEAAVRRRGRDMGDTISLDRGMCMMLADKGDAASALPHCREALELSIARHGSEHALVSMAHRALGNAHYAAGDYAAAGEAWEQATELFLQTHGVDHPEYPALLNSLAAACHSQGRGSECVGLFEQTVEAAVRSYGPEHPAVADFTNNLAIVLEAEGRLDEAEEHAKRSLTLRRARFGDAHPGVGAAHRVLARIALERDDPAGALHHAQRAVDIGRATRGGDHPDVIEALEVRAQAHERHDEGLDAVADWDEALAMATRLARPAPELARLRLSLARALHAHEPAQAERVRSLLAQAEAEDPSLAAEIEPLRAPQP